MVVKLAQFTYHHNGTNSITKTRNVLNLEFTQTLPCKRLVLAKATDYRLFLMRMDPQTTTLQHYTGHSLLRTVEIIKIVGSWPETPSLSRRNLQ
jgi:hypothetical protein